MKNMFCKSAYSLLIALAMTACTNENEMLQNGSDGIIQFTMSTGGVSTRTSTAVGEDIATTFVDNDEVGIFALLSDAAAATNMKYTLSGDKWSGGAIEAKEGTYSFYSYYPYAGSVTLEDNFTHTVQTAQNVAANYNKSDLLLAKAENVTCDGTKNLTVNLEYQHALALVQVVISGDKFTEAPTSVKLAGLSTKANVAVKTAAVTVADAETKGNIEMYNAVAYKDNAATYLAVVPAQTVAGETEILELTIGNMVYKFTPTSGFDLNAGKVRTINVTMGEAQKPSFSIDLDGLTIAGWGKGEAAIDGSLDEGTEKPEEPEVPQEPQDLVFSPLTTAGTTIVDMGKVAAGAWPEVATVGWFTKTVQGEITSTISEGVVSLDASTMTKSGNGLFYNFGNCKRPAGKYAVSCHIAAPNYGGTGLKCYFALMNINKTTGNTYGASFAFNTTTSTPKAHNECLACSNDFVTITSGVVDGVDINTTFDLSNGFPYVSGGTINVTTPEAFGAEAYDQLVLALIVASGGVYEISNITFAPATDSVTE